MTGINNSAETEKVNYKKQPKKQTKQKTRQADYTANAYRHPQRNGIIMLCAHIAMLPPQKREDGESGGTNPSVIIVSVSYGRKPKLF